MFYFSSLLSLLLFIAQKVIEKKLLDSAKYEWKKTGNNVNPYVWLVCSFVRSRKLEKKIHLIIYSIRFFCQFFFIIYFRFDVNELNNAILKEKLHAFLLSIRLYMHVNLFSLFVRLFCLPCHAQIVQINLAGWLDIHQCNRVRRMNNTSDSNCSNGIIRNEIYSKQVLGICVEYIMLDWSRFYEVTILLNGKNKIIFDCFRGFSTTLIRPPYAIIHLFSSFTWDKESLD